jgi:hypothetical protein
MTWHDKRYLFDVLTIVTKVLFITKQADFLAAHTSVICFILTSIIVLLYDIVASGLVVAAVCLSYCGGMDCRTKRFMGMDEKGLCSSIRSVKKMLHAVYLSGEEKEIYSTDVYLYIWRRMHLDYMANGAPSCARPSGSPHSCSLFISASSAAG